MGTAPWWYGKNLMAFPPLSWWEILTSTDICHIPYEVVRKIRKQTEIYEVWTWNL